MAPSRPPWDFDYAPVHAAARPQEPAGELVVATPLAVDPAHLAAAAGPGATAAVLLARAPLFWTRLSLDAPALPSAIAARLGEAGLALRYVASAEHPSLALAPALDLGDAPVARPATWAARAASSRAPAVADTPGSWFLREGGGGLAVDRARAGGATGAGTRLAVIDDDALGADALELDAEVPVALDGVPRHQLHGALMAAWATRARSFSGVAPDASTRLYVIPKPSTGVIGLPLAVARAAFDGADVIVCATYVDGATSPMLDDALEVASRLGRRGRGTAVVLPTGREASSVTGSIHASFSLGLGEPASDPRVFTVAPGARGGGWFFWRDRRGRSRPFANRGPAVRWLAPGDDIAYPFSAPGASERLFHAESSGAAALAAGVILLVLGVSPSLRLAELGAVLDATLVPVPPGVPRDRDPLADPADALPAGRDADGHNARHGLGLLSAADACLFATDPICAALLRMGESGAARAWDAARQQDPTIAAAYSGALGRWAVRALFADPALDAALRVLLRHARLVAGDATRQRAHGEGAVARQVGLLLRRLAAAPLRAPIAVRAEARRLADVAAPASPSGSSDSPRALEAAVGAALYPLIVPPVPS
jgi:hypothetical protein